MWGCKVLVGLVLVVMSSSAWALDIREVHMPYIKGDTLYINGKISHHIYNYIAYERNKLTHLKAVSLNSFGGSSEWGLEIARQISELGLATELSPGNVCASSCVALFAAGVERRMAPGTWLGVHGARLGGPQVDKFEEHCRGQQTNEYMVQVSTARSTCSRLIHQWYQDTLHMTEDFFAALESYGVSPRLHKDYFAMADDPEWAESYNILRKPDLVLSAKSAREYNLATAISP